MGGSFSHGKGDHLKGNPSYTPFLRNARGKKDETCSSKCTGQIIYRPKSKFGYNDPAPSLSTFSCRRGTAFRCARSGAATTSRSRGCWGGGGGGMREDYTKCVTTCCVQKKLVCGFLFLQGFSCPCPFHFFTCLSTSFAFSLLPHSN